MLRMHLFAAWKPFHSPLCAQMTLSRLLDELTQEGATPSSSVRPPFSSSPLADQQTSAKRSLARLYRLFKSFRHAFVAST